MVYRKKILLAIVELFGGKLSATDFQKLLFIFCNNQPDCKFDFVPYKYGCFSFLSMSDKNNLIYEGYLKDEKFWSLKIQNGNFLNALKDEDRKQLINLKKRYSHLTTEELIRYIYLNYPYFAINSEIAPKYLSNNELKIIDRYKPKENEQKLFTLGYEGRSLEQYLNLLIMNNVKVLCDVRKNPISRKYGFSKRTLQNACESLNIKYIHLPELGIISEKRKDLKTQSDYENLFLEYERTVIPNQKKALKLIYDLLNNYKRVTLTCFEALSKQCHRERVARAVCNIDNTILVKHI